MATKVLGLLNLYSSPELGKLTAKRAPGAVSFMGRFALMDFPLSNFTNSGIDEFSIIVKNNIRSVTKHVGSMKTWVCNTKIGHQFLLVNEQGIADEEINTDLNNLAVNEWVFDESNPDLVVIQPAHILTTMDLRKVIEAHKANGSEITVAYKKIKNADKDFVKGDVLEITKDGEIINSKRNSGDHKVANVSLETYVINKDFLLRLIHDKKALRELTLRKAIIKFIKGKTVRVMGYEYEGFAMMFDCFETFMKNSFRLLDYEEATQLFDTNWTAYTIHHSALPSIYGENAKVKNSFVANGAQILGRVENSIISRDVKVAEGAVIKNSILLTSVEVKEGALVENALLDKHVKISKNAEVIGHKTEYRYIEQGKVIK